MIAAHHCHAHNCQRRVPAKMFMCRDHWFALEPRLQKAIWAEYREGQEVDKDPSNRYLAVQQYAIGSLVFKPHDEQAAIDATPYFVKAMLHQITAINSGEGNPMPWVKFPEGILKLE